MENNIRFSNKVNTGRLLEAGRRKVGPDVLLSVPTLLNIINVVDNSVYLLL
jgi:hypothetical protein